MLVFAIEFNIRVPFIYVKHANEESYDFEFPNLLQSTKSATQLLVSII
jgi:hypothetical protein